MRMSKQDRQCGASKLRSEHGETLVEVLVSMVITALSMSMLALAIRSAYNMMERSKQYNEQYYAATSSIATHASPEDGIITVSMPGTELAAPSKEYTVTMVSKTLPGAQDVVSYRVEAY